MFGSIEEETLKDVIEEFRVKSACSLAVWGEGGFQYSGLELVCDHHVNSIDASAHLCCASCL